VTPQRGHCDNELRPNDDDDSGSLADVESLFLSEGIPPTGLRGG
jgi:hypothetical protein